MKHYSNFKVVKTGKIFEFYISEIPFSQNTSYDKLEKETTPTYDQLPLEFKTTSKPDRTEEYQARSAYRARNKIRRLVQSNFYKNSKFITLTFSDNNNFDINDPNATQSHFKNFIRRLKYSFGDFRYLAVVEFQKRGAVHYHMVADIPYIEHKKLQKLWGYGFVGINKIFKAGKVGVYVSKYLTKDAYNSKYDKCRKYFYSRNLKKPVIYYGSQAFNLFNTFYKVQGVKKFTSQYYTPYNGLINYIEFNFYEGGDP